jgi:hypothetical protein
MIHLNSKKMSALAGANSLTCIIVEQKNGSSASKEC